MTQQRKEVVMAGYSVTGDQYRNIDRKMRDIKRQLDEKGGSPLDPEAVNDSLQLILEGEFPPPHFKRDMAKEAGWTLDEDVGFNPTISSVGELEFASFLNDDEDSVSGEELAKRAKLLNANLGQKHAEWLLDHQEEIPEEEWRGSLLVFPGTVWRDAGGFRLVPCLSWSGERWRLSFLWLAFRFSSFARLVRSRA